MIRNFLTFSAAALAALMMLASANLAAQDNGDGSSLSGTIKSISTSTRSIRIDGKSYKYSATTRIYLEGGDPSDQIEVDDLLPGYPVKFKLSVEGNPLLLTEIAILTD